MNRERWKKNPNRAQPSGKQQQKPPEVSILQEKQKDTLIIRVSEVLGRRPVPHNPPKSQLHCGCTRKSSFLKPSWKSRSPFFHTCVGFNIYALAPLKHFTQTWVLRSSYSECEYCWLLTVRTRDFSIPRRQPSSTMGDINVYATYVKFNVRLQVS